MEEIRSIETIQAICPENTHLAAKDNICICIDYVYAEIFLLLGHFIYCEIYFAEVMAAYFMEIEVHVLNVWIVFLSNMTFELVNNGSLSTFSRC